MGRNCKKWASTIVGTNPGNMYVKFQKIWTKTEGGDRFLRKWANWAHFCPFPGPWAKIAKSGLVLLTGLTQGTCVPNFKRFKPKLREEIGF